MLGRRFTPPWDIEDNRSYFIIRDNSSKHCHTFIMKNEPGRSTAAGLLTRDEARRIANNIAELPELIRQAPK
jgi:hypothetical protein